MLLNNFEISALREPVLSGQTRPESWRRLQLQRIEQLINENESEIFQALNTDLGKPQTEALFEISALRQELKLAKKELSKWMKPRKIEVPISLKPGKGMVVLEPLGCVLIIGPWNYPFSLTLQPLISALAAGNTAVIKPSENANSTSKLIANIIPKYFPSEIVQVFEGNGDLAKSLIEQSFDHIFFTGGSNIGKKVMEGASKHLTPVTLELGGKSPALVLQEAEIETTAQRLIWGKGLNAGQTCIAPNHIIVLESLYEDLIIALKKVITTFYGNEPTNSKDLSKIINTHHFNRLNELLKVARNNNQIIFGGSINKESFKISPTLIKVEGSEDLLLSEEIFGPLLPIIRVPNFKSAISLITKQPKPLAIYMFGGSAREKEAIINQTSSGGMCFNDVVLQVGVPEMPFGGVGASGMGRYHGIAGFETFSHQKSILSRPFWLDTKFRYPPYRINISLLKKLLR